MALLPRCLLFLVPYAFAVFFLVGTLRFSKEAPPNPPPSSPLASHLPGVARDARGHPSLAHPLCIVGNAEKAQLASHISSTYFPSTPAVWNVWGSDHKNLSIVTRPRLLSLLSAVGKPAECIVLQPAPRSTWVSAIESGVRLFRDPSTGDYDCAYFLFLDDDIDFDLLNVAEEAKEMSVEEYTNYLLAKYQPAVLAPAGFVGQRAAIGQPGDEVALTTAFDNAEVILHSSLMDFLLPFAPRGEGGFEGSWTLPAIHMMLFFPSMYRGNALMATQLHYVNKIRLSPKAISADSKLAVHNGSRHVYEYPQNAAYKDFLRLGMKSFQCAKFGTEADVEQIGWAVSPPPEDGARHAYVDFLPRINAFYDLLHPAVAERPWVAERYGREQLLAQRMSLSHFRLQLIVITRDRLASLQRLIKSVLAADYSQARFPIDLTVEVDFSPTQPDVRRYLDTVSWAHGRLTVRYSPLQRGLRATILNSWYPTSLDEMAVFLEDDVEVSPLFLRWLLPSVGRYYYGFDGLLRDNPLVGIALYSPIHSQVYETAFRPRTDAPAYAHQLACSWGALFTPRVWREFLAWYDRNSAYDPLVPGLININRWAMTQSWKKFLIRFMTETGSYMIYPNIGYNESFSTNHVELGENEQSTNAQVALRQQLTVGLARSRDAVTAATSQLPAWQAMVKYDVYEREVRLAANSTRFPQPAWRAMDQFTVLLTSRTRNATELAQSVDYWQAMPQVREIVVRWLEEEGSEAALAPQCPTSGEYVQVRCRVENVGRSIQNRFLPLPDATTLAVLSLDADVRIGRADVEFAFYTIQMHPDQLVGFEQCAAGFIRGPSPSGNYSYIDNSATPYVENKGLSMALTSAAFFQTAYLSAYWNSSSVWEQARAMVETAQTGEDLLMNLLVAQSPINTKPWVYLVTGAVQRTVDLGADEQEKRDSLLGWLAEHFQPWPLVTAKPFPAKWMKMWKDAPRLPRPVRLPSFAAGSGDSSLSSSSPLPVDIDGKVTVIVTSYQTNFRTAWVRNTIKTYLSAAYEDVIDRVILVWNNPDVPCPISFNRPNFIVLNQKVNSLNARWTETIPHVRTAAVLNVDDDIFIDRSAVRCMLGWWRHDPQRLVAPFVRRIFPNATYVMDDLLQGDEYSVALPRAVLVATTELQRYADSPAALRRYVDEQEAHCDDIFLNAISVNYTNKVPLRIQLPASSVADYFATCARENREAVGGLALQKDRTNKRSECTKHIADAFPGWGNPLFKHTKQVAQCAADGSMAGITEEPQLNLFKAMFRKTTCT
jgi:hypothetical protein